MFRHGPEFWETGISQWKYSAGGRLRYKTFKIDRISVIYRKKTSTGQKSRFKESRAGDDRKVSRAFCGFVIVTRSPLALYPIHNLLDLVVPIGPEDNQTTNDAGGQQSNRETNPKTPEFHILFEGEIDPYRDSKSVIRTKSGEDRR